MKWQTQLNPASGQTQEPKSYKFYYDNLNRMLDAQYVSPITGNAKFDETLSYDELGNVLTLERHYNSYATINNNISYNYMDGGNRRSRVMGVTDIGTVGQSLTSTYTYDAMGSLTGDSRKTISGMVYNELNLPDMIPMTGKTVYYIYDANGTKLQRLVKNGTTVLEDRSYVDGIEYNGNTFDFAQTSEGRVMAIVSPSTYHKYEYFLKDHLGNVRATFSDLTGGHNISPDDILQTNDYFPFGRTFNGFTATGSKDQQYKYNGKEFEDDEGEYDYGARFYDPYIARFTTIDPYSDFFPWMTNYQYASNNPSTKIDLDGLEGITPTFMFEESAITFESPVENLSRAGGEWGGEPIAQSSPKFEWHHIIPQALRKLEIIKQAIREGFGFDEMENLTRQEKFSRATGLGRHGSHPKYNNAIAEQLQNASKNNSGASAADIVRAVANNARQTINNNPGTKINNLYQYLLAPKSVPSQSIMSVPPPSKKPEPKLFDPLHPSPTPSPSPSPTPPTPPTPTPPTPPTPGPGYTWF